MARPEENIIIEDNIYVTRVKEGDKEAFGGLYDKYIEQIYRFVYYKVFNKEITEDIVSDVFFKALDRIHSFDQQKAGFSSWLYAIARNTVTDHFRTDRKNENIEDIFDIGVDDRTIEQSDASKALKEVEDYLRKLNATQREIVILRIWEDMSYKEIAAVTGGTEGSVKMNFSRLIKKIREDLKHMVGSGLPFMVLLHL
jgi:RNA polymerase sigma-70 factor, ECF subfamily